jgi:2-succinyl-6-hydroxy-2,4-cyclohexadiene-1-carboxylate synthase
MASGPEAVDPRNRHIHVEHAGSGQPRLVLVHGFTQTGRSWRRVLPELSVDHEVAVVDAPGHGDSSPAVNDLWTGARDIVEAAGDGVYVGYSMGARYALAAALCRPDAVRGLILLGANPGIEDDAERADRARHDAELAAGVERDGVSAFVESWLDQPLFATLPHDAADVEDRRRNSALGLASSLRHAGTGVQDVLWDRVRDIRVPVLVLAGEADAKFRMIGERLAAAVGAGATYAVVPGAGHAAHLEKPDDFARLVRNWLDANVRP